MKTSTKAIARILMTLAIAGLGLALTPGVARATVFTVDEGSVLGANDVDVQADGLTGKYQEHVILGAGTFDASIVVQFTAYTLAGSPTTDQIGAILGGAGEVTDTNLYGLYALVTVSGTFSTIGLGGGLTQFIFAPDTADASIHTDPLRNTEFDYTVPSVTAGGADDQLVFLGGDIAGFPLSNGFTTVDGTDVVGGSFALLFQQAIADPAYWTTIGFPLVFQLTASGDVDPSSECGALTPPCVFPTDVRGDVSASPQLVPEPATLTLFGLGALGAGAALRRRRKA